jgi:hypothetical protein
MAIEMPFSAYCPRPSFSSQSETCCITAAPRIIGPQPARSASLSLMGTALESRRSDGQAPPVEGLGAFAQGHPSSYGLPVGAALHRAVAEGACADGGRQRRTAHGRDAARRGDQSAPSESVPALRVRHVDEENLSSHSSLVQLRIALLLAMLVTHDPSRKSNSGFCCAAQGSPPRSKRCGKVFSSG